MKADLPIVSMMYLVYIQSDQPTTCPKCGSRTDLIVDFSHIKPPIEIEQCLDSNCGFVFAVGDE
jgi:hypothetical protein